MLFMLPGLQQERQCSVARSVLSQKGAATRTRQASAKCKAHSRPWSRGALSDTISWLVRPLKIAAGIFNYTQKWLVVVGAELRCSWLKLLTQGRVNSTMSSFLDTPWRSRDVTDDQGEGHINNTGMLFRFLPMGGLLSCFISCPH